MVRILETIIAAALIAAPVSCTKQYDEKDMWNVVYAEDELPNTTDPTEACAQFADQQVIIRYPHEWVEENGRTIQRTRISFPCKNGKPHGMYKAFDKAGKLSHEVEYVNGAKLVGTVGYSIDGTTDLKMPEKNTPYE